MSITETGNSQIDAAIRTQFLSFSAEEQIYFCNELKKSRPTDWQKILEESTLVNTVQSLQNSAQSGNGCYCPEVYSLLPGTEVTLIVDSVEPSLFALESSLKWTSIASGGFTIDSKTAAGLAVLMGDSCSFQNINESLLTRLHASKKNSSADLKALSSSTQIELENRLNTIEATACTIRGTILQQPNWDSETLEILADDGSITIVPTSVLAFSIHSMPDKLPDTYHDLIYIGRSINVWSPSDHEYRIGVVKSYAKMFGALIAHVDMKIPICMDPMNFCDKPIYSMNFQVERTQHGYTFMSPYVQLNNDETVPVQEIQFEPYQYIQTSRGPALVVRIRSRNSVLIRMQDGSIEELCIGQNIDLPEANAGVSLIDIKEEGIQRGMRILINGVNGDVVYRYIGSYTSMNERFAVLEALPISIPLFDRYDSNLPSNGEIITTVPYEVALRNAIRLIEGSTSQEIIRTVEKLVDEKGRVKATITLSEEISGIGAVGSQLTVDMDIKFLPLGVYISNLPTIPVTFIPISSIANVSDPKIIKGVIA